MAKCLITKVAASATSRMKKLGELDIVVTGSGIISFGYIAKDITIIGEGLLINGLETVTPEKGHTFEPNIELTSEQGIIHIMDKSNLPKLGNNSISILASVDELMYCSSLTTIALNGEGITGDINSILCNKIGAKIKSLSLNNTNVDCHINRDWNAGAELATFIVSGAVSGDLSQFHNAIHINYLQANLSGNINELLDALYSNGKTSGNLFISDKNALYNNSPFVSSKTFKFTETGWSE